MARNAKYIFELEGERVLPATGTQELKVLSTFSNDSVQDNLSTSELTFALDTKDAIDRWVRDGAIGGVGIFEGMELDVFVENAGARDNVGRFLLDFSTYSVEERRTNVGLIYRDGLNIIADRTDAASFGWLEEIGLITEADFVEVDYTISLNDEALKIANLIILGFLAERAIEDTISKLAGIVAQIAAFSAEVGFGEIIMVIFQGIVLTTYLAALVISFVNVTKQLLDALAPIKRKLNAMTFRTMLEKVAEYLEYPLDTNLPLENYIHVPSTKVANDRNLITGVLTNPRRNQSGIPTVGDTAYSIPGFLDLIKKMFDGRYAIIDGVFTFRNRNDEFWLRNSEFRLRSDTYIPKFEYNTEDLKGRRLFSFATDVTDSFTITEFKGNNYEIITRPIRVKREGNSLIKGFEGIQFPVALGTRKEVRSALDRTLLAVARVVDTITSIFGEGTNFASRINDTSGILKVSDANFATAKVLYMVDGSIPANHRDILSAKAIYERYYEVESFLNKGQKRLVKGLKIPFNFENWLQVRNNSYFYDEKGRECKIVRLEWSVLSDFATIDYWCREVYTTNLEEEFIEG